MKSVRVLLIGVSAVLLVFVLALVVALTPGFQTWAVRRALAARPALHLSVGHVAAGFSRVTLTEVQFDRQGVRLTAPRVEAELPVWRALWSKQVQVRRLAAEGWVLDASAAKMAGPVPPAERAPYGVAHPPLASVAGAPSTRPIFAGVLRQLTLPCDFALDSVVLEGTVTLPAKLGHARLRVTGGGLRAGNDGKFAVTARGAVRRAGVEEVTLAAVVTASMTSPRELGRVQIASETTAAGSAFVHPVRLHGDASIARAEAGEVYALTLAKADRALVEVRAEYPELGQPLRGHWKVDVRNADFAVLAQVRSLPTFTAAGEGVLDADAALTAVHAVGRLDAAVTRLDVLWPRLSGIGAVKVAADVDVAQRGSVLSVAKLHVNIGANAPVATLDALQSFAFNPGTGELEAADPAKDLIGLTLQAIPLAWAKPFVPGLQLAGHDLRGELVAAPRAGGFTVRTKSSLLVAGLSAAYGGHALLQDVDVSLNASGDYTPHGWQAELNGMTAKSGAATMLLIDAKAGQLAGAGQPVKVTGLISGDVAALIAQPVGRGWLRLQRGEGTVDFTGSFGASRQLEAKVALKNLVPAGGEGEALPQVSAMLRADIGPGAEVTLNAPVVLERAGRKSDLALSGKFTAAGDGQTMNAQLTSSELVVDDAKLLMTLAGGTTPKPGTANAATPTPPWAGVNGTLALSLKHVVYSSAFELRNVTGTVRLTRGALQLENLRAGVPEDGKATINGQVTFGTGAASKFAAVGEIGLEDFDAATFFRLADFKAPPPLEGKFAIAMRLDAQAPTWRGLSHPVMGSYDVTSRGGVFRGVPVNVGNLVENSSKLAAWIASAGSALVGWAGRKEDYDEITSRSQAANELAKALSTIAYDQLGLVVRREAAASTDIKEFTLISPDLRLKGSGRTRHVPGRPMLNDEVDLDMQIRARGRPAELLKYLGILDPKPDDLGYAACTIPLHLGGTVGRPEAHDFSNRLIALAVEKTGILDRAGAKALDWINRLRGR
jgi:hypothetical protein